MANGENLLTTEQIAARGEKIYAEKLKPLLEPKENGKFVAIEVESEDYFIGMSILEAIDLAKKKYPTKLFHTVRVGYPGVFKLGAYSKKGISYGWKN